MATNNGKCIIHYDQLNIQSPRLTLLNAQSYERLIKSRDSRLRLGGIHSHEKQVKSVPAVFSPDTLFVHRQCYQNFTKAVSIEANQLETPKTAPLERRKRSLDNAGILFPRKCMKCDTSNPLKVKGKKQDIKVLQTLSSCESIQNAAKLHNDQDMLIKISGQDLIAKEFMMHPKCYREYTRITTTKSADADNSEEQSDMDQSQGSSVTNFSALCDFVNDHVIAGRKSVSLRLLTDIYGFDEDDSRLRAKVKQRIQKEFGEQVIFLRVSYHQAEILISSAALCNTTVAQFTKENKQFILKEAAKILRSDILTMIENAPELPWPPTPDALSNENRRAPKSVGDFILQVIHATHHTAGEEVKRYVDSYSQDLVHAVSKGKFFTQKHVLLGAGLHSLTGQKLPIKILGRLGHCCNYDNVRLIETAQAEVIQKLRSLQHPLPLLPATNEKSVLTYFWWDNFDVQKENVPGSLHTTHGIAYQVESPDCIKTLANAEIQKSYKKAVVCTPHVLPQRNIVPHTAPALFEAVRVEDFDGQYHSNLLFLWKLMRRVFDQSPQCISRFVGWILLTFGKPESTATSLTFLPPIARPITEYSTVIECIKQSQMLSAAANMKYAHITVDAGAAMKFYHVIWNNTEEFKNVFIHLGDFHGMMEFFGTIGKLVTGSGFEEIVYQAGMCTSGGIKGVISGKHYNRAWLVYECVAEAVDRLFCEAFFPDIPEDVKGALSGDLQNLNVHSILDQSTFTELSSRYQNLKKGCISGDFGKTPQFWMIFQAAVDRQHKLHLSVNTNDFDLRLQCWKESLPLCFAMNKHNYSRYGAYYVKSLVNIDTTHPQAREELEERGLSVCRNSYNIGQSIDGAGEQTFMRSAKTTGGIKNFAHQQPTYEKWVLNRPFQAKIVESLQSLTDVDKAEANPRKCLRVQQIKKSEEQVKEIMQIMKDTFINPFSEELNKDKLFNLASGRPLSDDISHSLLSVEIRGKELLDAFNQRLHANSEQQLSFFDPIKRVPWKGFSEAVKKVKVTVGNKTRDVAVQRDILGLLLTTSFKEGGSIDIDKALTYSLAPVPLALATSDGYRRKTAKSKLLHSALESIKSDEEPPANASCYIIDLAASLRSIVKIPDTFRELAQKIMREIPRHYRNVYIVCDTYADCSIKGSERDLRGNADEFVIRNADIRIPPNFKDFMSNGTNKERLFEIIEQVCIEKATSFGNKVVYFARKDSCIRISSEGVTREHALQTNHEEADTKICYLLHHALRLNNGEETVCVVRSSSGDVDIPIILLANEAENLHVFIDNGTGKNRQLLDLTACALSQSQKQALLGMHAFSGNDYISSFLRKGKPAFWKLVKNSEMFQDMFGELGRDNDVSESLMLRLEAFVCTLYGERRLESVNEARQAIFWRSFEKNNKVIDLSLLPPCKSSLEKHIARANLVARIWRQASQSIINVQEPVNHGWLEDMSIDWVTKPYPEDIAVLLINDGEMEEEEGSN